MKRLLTPAILLALAISTVKAEEWDIVTLAGTGQPGFSGDGGPAMDAQINLPFGVEVGPDRQLYLCDTGNHVVRKIDRRTGTITTVAGLGGVSGYSGDGGPAIEAKLLQQGVIARQFERNLLACRVGAGPLEIKSGLARGQFDPHWRGVANQEHGFVEGAVFPLQGGRQCHKRLVSRPEGGDDELSSFP